jgi:hypothetical protein
VVIGLLAFVGLCGLVGLIKMCASLAVEPLKPVPEGNGKYEFGCHYTVTMPDGRKIDDVTYRGSVREKTDFPVRGRSGDDYWVERGGHDWLWIAGENGVMQWVDP